MNEKKPKLPSLSKVKRALLTDWALRVKQRDGWKCLLCGNEDLLTAHHWHVCDHNAHMARYCVANGATLCYTCHIRGIHQRADHFTARRIWRAVTNELGRTPEDEIERLAAIEVTTASLRALWDRMRTDTIDFSDYGIAVTVKGRKLFVTVNKPRPVAVVGNAVLLAGWGKYEVTAIKAQAGQPICYTLNRLEDDE